jgi:hypothetical protein
MRALSDFVTVKAPSSFALAYLSTSFLERGAQGEARLALRFPLPSFPIDGLTLEKTVELKLTYDGSDAATRALAIRWEPAGTRALPAFSGGLSAVDQGPDACLITLAGTYAPPGRVVGTLFDNLIGVWIARASISALLAQFAREIEADYSVRSRP